MKDWVRGVYISWFAKINQLRDSVVPPKPPSPALSQARLASDRGEKNGLQPNSNGLQPSSGGLQPTSDI